MKYISQDVLDQSYDYESYRALVDRMHQSGKATGGQDSESMLRYTELNMKRMARLDKTTKLLPEVSTAISQVEGRYVWLVLTEGWCGDAAQIAPVMHALASQTPNVELRFILRDENLDIMDAFLTNGGRSIPKIVFLEKEGNRVLGSWGPRPEEVQKAAMELKAALATIDDADERSSRYQEGQKQTQLWYARDKTRSIQRELVEAFKNLISEPDLV